MSKKKTGLLIALGAVLGAAATGASYYLKYRSFSDELDRDFHDYEDEDFSMDEADSDSVSAADSANRTYISLESAKAKTCEDAKPAEQEETKEEAAAPESSGAVIEEETEGIGE